MKVAILGTRGIPNNYGGFEQCAENLSMLWVKQGYDVTVYSPDEHPYKNNIWKGVKIKHIFSKESKLKIWGTFIYDYLCLKDAIKKDYDIILELGYVPSAFFFALNRKRKAKLITNMDGLEWKRSKWTAPLRKFTKYCEKMAVYYSDVLIADNLAIKDYLLQEYNKESFYIPYGAKLFDNPSDEYLRKFCLEKFNFFLLLARLEPENNIELILDGYLLSNADIPFIVIGNLTNYAKKIQKKYENISKIKFLGPIYDYNVLSSLRWYSKLYFHGHSIGGTNPSLLEAMASSAYIVAHDNPFNRYVLGDDAFYFKTTKDIGKIIKNYTDEFREIFTKKNRCKIEKIYNWSKVSEQYLNVFKKSKEKREKR